MTSSPWPGTDGSNHSGRKRCQLEASLSKSGAGLSTTLIAVPAIRSRACMHSHRAGPSFRTSARAPSSRSGSEFRMTFNSSKAYGLKTRPSTASSSWVQRPGRGPPGSARLHALECALFVENRPVNAGKLVAKRDRHWATTIAAGESELSSSPICCVWASIFPAGGISAYERN